MEIVRIGLDLAKNVFQVHGVGGDGSAVLRKTLRREAMMPFFSELAPCLVGMEACSGAHCWARALSDLGHEVRLISPQFVTPYVKSNRNGRNDAEAICEAVGRLSSPSSAPSPCAVHCRAASFIRTEARNTHPRSTGRLSPSMASSAR